MRPELRHSAVIGASGFIGQELKVILSKTDSLAILSPSSKEVDITDIFAVESWLDTYRPSAVVLLAAMADVGGAERDPETCWRLNVTGLLNIASLTAERGIHLTYLSTGYVFINSPAKPPYKIHDQIGEVNLEGPGVYERTKKLAEVIVREVNPNHSIIRIDFPFGNIESDKDLCLKILGAINKGYPLINDHYITPSYIPDIAKGVEKILRARRRGTFQIVCKNSVTPFEFGNHLVETLGLNRTIQPITYSEYMSVPGRLAQTESQGLDVTETEAILDFDCHTWQSAIDEMVPKLIAKLFIS